MFHICYLVGLITMVLLKHSGLHQGGPGRLRKKYCRLIANKQITYIHCFIARLVLTTTTLQVIQVQISINWKKLLWLIAGVHANFVQTYFYGNLNLDETKSYYKVSFHMISCLYVIFSRSTVRWLTVTLVGFKPLFRPLIWLSRLS